MYRALRSSPPPAVPPSSLPITMPIHVVSSTHQAPSEPPYTTFLPVYPAPQPAPGLYPCNKEGHHAPHEFQHDVAPHVPTHESSLTPIPIALVTITSPLPLTTSPPHLLKITLTNSIYVYQLLTLTSPPSTGSEHSTYTPSPPHYVPPLTKLFHSSLLITHRTPPLPKRSPHWLTVLWPGLIQHTELRAGGPGVGLPPFEDKL